MSILICQLSGLNWPNGSVPRHLTPAMAGQEVERTCRVASSFTSRHRRGRSASRWCRTGGSLSRPPRQGRQGGPRDPARAFVACTTSGSRYEEVSWGRRIYKVSREESASAAALPGDEPPIPNIRVNFPLFGPKSVHLWFSRHFDEARLFVSQANK